MNNIQRVVVACALAMSPFVLAACGDEDGDGVPFTNHDAEVACSPGGSLFPCGGGGAVPVDNDQADPNNP